MFDKFRLKEVLVEYKKRFVQQQWPNEKYKWEAVQCFQLNWDVNSDDFAQMLTKSLAQTANLLTSVNNFPARMITKFAEIAPEEVRSMYIELYDESKDLYERVASFKNKSNTLLERYGNGAAQHYQYENAIMTYLWLRYPDKYYIYKLSEVKAVSSELESDYRFKKGAYADNIRNFVAFYDEICAELQQDDELKNLLNSQLTSTCYADPELRTLTIDGKGDRSRNFIFNDLQFHSVFEGENAFIDIDTDMKAKQNWLRFTKRRPTEKEGGVLSLLASVKGCLTYFQNGARNLSFNYKHHKDEDKRPGDDDYTFENAIESVLTEFHLSREQIRYLKPIVMGGQVKSKKDKKDSNGKMSLKYFDRSVYNRGFRYYDFIDDPNHSMRSEIQLFDFQDSPEHILLHLSEKAQIIGISATATLETVVGNYDLEYLQRMLQDKYYVMPEADRCRLQESFQTFVANYDKVNIHVEPVSYNADDRVELSEIFNGNEALIKKYAEKLSISFERVEYAKNNFIRVVKVMKAFILNDSVKSFLCLNNKLPQENKGLFDIKLLEEFADAIIKLYGIKGLKGKDLLYSINSEDYDAKRAEFIQRLSKGEKLFVISSYNTVGAGQNLQYKAPGNATIVAVNDYDRGDMEKDFDCIYLEKPTNLLVNVDSKKGIEAEDLIRFVYQMEFLMERGEVSRKDGIAVIKDAFICFSGGYTFSGKKGEPYKTDSVNNFAIRTLIQAVGRICRTGLKNPDIYIYVDNTILTDYDLSVVEQRMLNPEFAELVKVGKTYYNGQANENLDIAVMENRAGALALKAMQIINELKRNWTDDSIDYWKALRELCLMRPTLSRKNVEQNSQYQLVYMCAPGEITAYSYEQEGDYNKNINIKFDGSLPQKMSEDEVHLKEIMQIPGVKALFEKHGYATSFVPSEFILTPPMFNNIYKGALGEVVGKYILEQYAGVTLQEMPPEFFELFDYTLGNGVYVDFKLWKETMLISAEEEKKNVLEKLDKCGGKRAVIINIMLDHNMQITSSDNGRIIEIPYLYRLDRKEIGTEIIAKINREGYLQ